MSLDTLLPELQLIVAQHLLEPRDCAAMCLAHPRLGLEAQRGLAQYQGPLFCVALRLQLAPCFSIDEPLLRRYAADAAFTREGCEWLRQAGSGLRLACRTIANGPHQNVEEWRLARPWARWASFVMWANDDRVVEGALVMVTYPNGRKLLFEGKKGAERCVREERPSGHVAHYEGGKGAERFVRVEHPSGMVAHYEGEKGAERCVRVEHPSGNVAHYEGGKGAERFVRVEHPSDKVSHYEGEKGAERKVRVDHPSGWVEHFKGEKGAERKVRVEFIEGHPDHGEIRIFDGGKHVRTEFSKGHPNHGEICFFDGGAVHGRTVFAVGHPKHGEICFFDREHSRLGAWPWFIRGTVIPASSTEITRAWSAPRVLVQPL